MQWMRARRVMRAMRVMRNGRGEIRRLWTMAGVGLPRFPIYPLFSKLSIGAVFALLLSLPGLAASAAAQNLVPNPHFHADVAGWELLTGDLLMWTNLADEGECPGSGSALVTSELVTSQHVAAFKQCFPFTGPSDLFFSVRHMGYGTFRVELDFFLGSDCYQSLTATIASEPQTAGVWKEFGFQTWAPSDTHSIELRFYGSDSAPHGLSVDEITLSRHPPIFLDGFDGSDGLGDESNPPCRW